MTLNGLRRVSISTKPYETDTNFVKYVQMNCEAKGREVLNRQIDVSDVVE